MTHSNNGHIEELSAFDVPLIGLEYIPDNTPTADIDLGALRREVTRQGIDLSQAKHQTAIISRRAKARTLAESIAPNKPPKWFYALKSLIQSTGNAILLVVMLLLSYVALPVAILGLAYAEIQRVALGVSLFDAPRANLMAVVAVTSYLILLVVQAGMNRQSPNTTRPVWSLRLFLAQIGYILGISRKWQPITRNREQLLNNAIARIGWLIILLGTAGSLQTQLSIAKGAWYQAVIDILTKSDLITFLTLAGGVSLTAGLLAGLHFSVGLAYGKWAQLIPETSTDFLAESGGFSAAEDKAEYLYLMSLLERSRKQQQA